MPKKAQVKQKQEEIKKNSVPKVLKVKDEAPSEKFADIHPNLPQMPSLCLIIGSVRSGKSNLLVNYFCNDQFYKDKFDVVKFVSTTLHTDNKGKILSKHFDCTDRYDDNIIENIKQSQGQYENKEDRPTYALVMDDVLTKDFKKTNQVSFFSTRFRHYIDFYIIAVQSFRAVSGMIRNNAQDVIICKQQNIKELEKIAEEYGDMVGGHDNFIKLYEEAHKDRYSFLYLKLSENPAEAYIRHETKIWPTRDTEEQELEID
jgi:GTPase SAR1 family protein